jgi:AAA+ ATPase superfamily predicted ATPase
VSTFVGRKEELKLLRSLLEKNTASIAVVYGRRRVGKSRLIEEFGKNLTMHSFSGLPPRPNTTVTSQLDEFSRQVARQFHVPQKSFTDWGDAFSELYLKVKNEKTVLFLDEIQWLGNCDPDFLGKLKNAWDMQFKKNDHLIVILCGSVSTWINENILSNTGFYGRVSLKIQLRDLSMKDCNEFWEKNNNHTSAHEKLKILSVTGGIPKYLEEIKINISAEENIKRLCFSESGLLFSDFDYIFSALLQKNSEQYEHIITALCENTLDQSSLLEHLHLQHNKSMKDYLDELIISGFLTRDHTWNLKTENISKLSKYRLADNYLRFYMQYIKPNIPKIRNNQFMGRSLTSLPGWSSIIGLQMENLVLNNRHDIKEKIGIYPDEVVYDNPYFQRKTTRLRGCQIDYMIQTKFGTLYLCEIKFSHNIIRTDVIEEVKEKIKRLSTPRNFSIKPVLIHAADVHDDVSDSGFFAKIIDLSGLLE